MVQRNQAMLLSYNSKNQKLEKICINCNKLMFVFGTGDNIFIIFIF